MKTGFWWLLIISVVALSGSLQLEKVLTGHYVLELFLLFIAVFLTLVALVGVAYDKAWGWPLSTIVLSLLILNAVVIKLSADASNVAFVVVLLACVWGVFMSFLRESSDDEDPLVTLPQLKFEKHAKSAKTTASKKRKK